MKTRYETDTEGLVYIKPAGDRGSIRKFSLINGNVCEWHCATKTTPAGWHKVRMPGNQHRVLRCLALATLQAAIEKWHQGTCAQFALGIARYNHNTRGE